eukprot:m.313799 g.313799  ORF g.313799 m.313799 type:complete len:116 (+) comp20260_c0_seq1:587-934(+)
MRRCTKGISSTLLIDGRDCADGHKSFFTSYARCTGDVAQTHTAVRANAWVRTEVARVLQRWWRTNRVRVKGISVVCTLRNGLICSPGVQNGGEEEQRDACDNRRLARVSPYKIST